MVENYTPPEDEDAEWIPLEFVTKRYPWRPMVFVWISMITVIIIVLVAILLHFCWHFWRRRSGALEVPIRTEQVHRRYKPTIMGENFVNLDTCAEVGTVSCDDEKMK